MSQTAVQPLAPLAPDSVIRLDPSQLRLFLDKSRVIVVCWHRQKGKDFTSAAKAVDDALLTGNNWHIVSLTQRQADATFEKVVKIAKTYKRLLGKIHIEDHEFVEDGFALKARELVLPNGAKVVALPGRNPDNLAGLTGNLILTEFALFDKGGFEHWGVLFPLITRGTLRLMAISTPRETTTKFQELLRNKDDQYSVHFCDIHQSVAEDGFKLFDAKGQPCDIRAFRKIYNDEKNWPREYECQPGDAESAFLSFELIRRCVEPNLKLLEDPAKLSGVCYGGYDVGRSRDLSFLWIDELIGDVCWTRMAVPLKNKTFREQRELLDRVMANPAVKRMCIDKGLIGLQLAEDLVERWGHRVEGVQLGPAVQSEAAMLLLGSMEDGRTRLPDLPEITASLNKPRKVMVAGNVRIETPRDEAGHCDEFWAKCLARLAAAGMTPPPPPQMEIPRHLAL